MERIFKTGETRSKCVPNFKTYKNRGYRTEQTGLQFVSGKYNVLKNITPITSCQGKDVREIVWGKMESSDYMKRIMESAEKCMEGMTGYGTLDGDQILEFLKNYHGMCEFFKKKNDKESLEKMDVLLFCTMKYMSNYKKT